MNQHEKLVYAMGRKYRVQATLRFRGRKYYVLKSLTTNALRPRQLVLDPSGGGALRVLLTLPKSSVSTQLISVLRSLPKFGELPRIIDVDWSKGDLRFLLDYIPGRPLSEYLAAIRRGNATRPTPYEAVRLVYHLSGALWNLHVRAGVVHGDIKPANLIITRKSSRICLIDFGNAYCIEQMVRRGEGDGVTPVYAPPELRDRSTTADGRIDQFSASVVLHELLTLRTPYDGLGGKAGASEFVAEFADEGISLDSGHEAFDLLPSQLRAEVTQVVARGLKLKIHERFEDTRSWRDALRRVLTVLDEYRQPKSVGCSRWEQFTVWLRSCISLRSTNR